MKTGPQQIHAKPSDSVPQARQSTGFKDRGGYSCTVRGSQGNIALYPKLKNSKYGRYKEAWHLLRGKPPRGEVTVARIDASARIY